jgi:hypothetical protein
MFRLGRIEGFPAAGGWVSLSALIRLWEGEQCRSPILQISARG